MLPQASDMQNSKPQPAVSVIIPVYNAEKYLRECLDSVTAQSLREIEIICVDDGSTDNSLKILREYAIKEPRLRVITQANARQGAARNRALDHASGEYIAFLDSDDAFAADALKKLYTRARNDALDMLMLSCVRVTPSGKEFRWSYHDFSKFLPLDFPQKCFSRKNCSPELFWRMPCSCCGTFYSRAFLEKNKLRFPEKIFFEDRPFFFFALAEAERIGILDEPLYRYTVNPNSTISSKGRHLADNIEQGSMILHYLKERNFPQELIREGIIAHVHDLLKSLGLSPQATLNASKDRLRESFEEFFPPQERKSLIAELITEQDRACTRLILGEATLADKTTVRLSALKYSLLKHLVSGERRERYFEKAGMSQKILSLKKPIPPAPVPEVSIIIPVYNAGKYLRECLDSVVNQTLKEIEIICVDDGSTDSSPQILREYAANDSRIKILQQQNRFAGTARNNGMAIARGKYLSFLDADDIFDKSMLKKAFSRAEKYSAEIVLWGGCTFAETLEKKERSKGILDFSLLPKSKVFSPAEIADRLFQIGWGTPWNKLFLRSFVEKNALEFSETRTSNDIYFVFAAMSVAEKIAYLKKYPVFYRRTGKGESLQESFEKSPADFVAAQTRLKQFLKEKTHGEFDLSFLIMIVCNSLWYLKRTETASREAVKTELLKNFPALARELPEETLARFPKWERVAYDELRNLIR